MNISKFIIGILLVIASVLIFIGVKKTSKNKKKPENIIDDGSDLDADERLRKQTNFEGYALAIGLFFGGIKLISDSFE